MPKPSSTADVCSRENPNKEADRGHSYSYTESGNRCGFCNRQSEHQDALHRQFGADVSGILRKFGPVTGGR